MRDPRSIEAGSRRPARRRSLAHAAWALALASVAACHEAASPDTVDGAAQTGYASKLVARETTAITQGREHFARWCVGCHGLEGRGDGINAAMLATPPADLTAAARVGTGDTADVEPRAAGLAAMFAGGPDAAPACFVAAAIGARLALPVRRDLAVYVASVAPESDAR